MLYFHCRFLLETGHKIDKIIPAEDHVALVEALANYEGVLTKTTKLPLSTFRMSTQDLIFFFTYLREFLMADIPLVEAIDTIADETRKINVKAIASKVHNDISNGYLLSDAMRNQNNVFSGISISLVAVSEKINFLASACNHIVNYLSFGTLIARKVRSVIAYPVVMFFMIFTMIVFYSKFVIPKLEAVFAEFGSADDVPIQTRLLVIFSDFISSYWAIILILSILTPLLCLLLYKKSHTFKIKFDSILLNIPLVSSFVIKSQLARFSLFTAHMYDKGYNFLDSISESVIVITNDRIRIDIENMIDNIKSGDAVYRSLRQIPYIPRFVHRMFRIAELTSNVQRPLTAIYDFYSDEIQNDLEKILKFIKPISIIMIGGLMLWIVSATLLPFYTKLPTLLGDSYA